MSRIPTPPVQYKCDKCTAVMPEDARSWHLEMPGLQRPRFQFDFCSTECLARWALHETGEGR